MSQAQDAPRPASVSRVQSMASVGRSSVYPLESAASSLSSFTSYFGASTLEPDETTENHERSDVQSPFPIIKKSFAPYVPVVASTDANDLAKQKGFSSFFDLLRPFGEKVEGKVSYRDSSGVTNQMDDFNLNFVEMGPASNLINYGQVELGRPSLASTQTNIYIPGGDLVALERQIEDEMHMAGENITQMIDIPKDASKPDDSSVYYSSFIQSILSGITTSPHETFSHPVATCIVISSHNQSPIESLVALYKSSSEHLPSFIDPGFLRYYILIHDEDEHDLDKSLALFSRMKNSFGIHCWMLRLSSKTVSLEDDAVLEVPVYGRRSAPECLRNKWKGRSNSFLSNTQDCEVPDKIRYLPYVDHSGLVTMVREMVVQSLVPYMERCINIWNEQVAGPRRGLAGRFLKVGRSFWGSSRTTTPTQVNGNYETQTSSYPPTSAEAQLRKLADFAFMLRDWKLANSIYDMIRKDYNNDKAWKHHAGAQEMFVITTLLMPGPITTKTRIDTIEPTLDSALYGYLSRCSAPFSALRAMLLTAELLRIRPGGARDDAAKWIMRTMESNLVGEMTRALLVERTAFCFSSGEVKSQTPQSYNGSRRRKAAFWRVLSAEHWSTIGKHRLARQSLKGALEVYGTNTRWVAIETTLKMLRNETGLTDSFLLTPAHVDREAQVPTSSPVKSDKEQAREDEEEYGEKTITMQTMDTQDDYIDTIVTHDPAPNLASRSGPVSPSKFGKEQPLPALPTQSHMTRDREEDANEKAERSTAAAAADSPEDSKDGLPLPAPPTATHLSHPEIAPRALGSQSPER